MSVRRWLQLAMLAVAAVVTGLVALNWEGGSAGPRPRPVIDLPEDGGNLLSSSQNPRYLYSDNGIPVYLLRADSGVAREGGRFEYRGDVQLDLYAPPEYEDAEQEVTTLLGERMEVDTVGETPTRIRLEGEVSIFLPSGAELRSAAVGYQRSSEEVRSDAGVEMRVAGLSLQARSLRYTRTDGRLEMWGGPPGSGGDRLLIAADPDAADTPISGSARSLSHTGDSGELELLGNPDVDLAGAAVAGATLRLALDEADQQIRGLEAGGDARLVWVGADGASRALEGETLSVELDDDLQPRTVRVPAPGPLAGAASAAGPPVAPGPRRPRLELATAADLRADRLDLHLLGEGRGSVVASGSVMLGGSAELGLDSLETASLRLSIGSEGLEEAVADGDVAVGLPAAGGGEAAALAGPRATFTWRDGVLDSGEWPGGLSYVAGSTRLEAAHGSYRPDEGTWIADGEPRPHLSSADADFDADRVVLRPDGGADVEGDVDAVLEGDGLGPVGALFREGDEIRAVAGKVVLEPGGGMSMEDSPRLVQGSQLLEASTIRVDPGAGILGATGGVVAFLQGGEGSGDLELAGDELLVEGDPPEVRVAGQARLDDGDRWIVGAWIALRPDDADGWQEIEVDGGTGGQVEMHDPAGVARGGRLLWDVETGVVTVRSGPAGQATFSNPRGVDIRDAEGLEFRWTDDGVRVRALEQGTTQTVRGGVGGRSTAGAGRSSPAAGAVGHGPLRGGRRDRSRPPPRRRPR